jgi:hypothetical protein
MSRIHRTDLPASASDLALVSELLTAARSGTAPTALPSIGELREALNRMMALPIFAQGDQAIRLESGDIDGLPGE